MGKWRVLTVVFAWLFFSSLFVNLWRFPVSTANPQFLDVHITPGGVVKLAVKESQVFSALVKNGTAPYTYLWTANGSLLGNGQNVSFSFDTATEDLIILRLSVTDAKGFKGYAEVAVLDPYLQPNLYFDSSVSSASIIFQTDGTGWTQAVNGTTMQILASSTNASDLITKYASNRCFFRAGRYVLDGSIRITNPCVIEGEGVNTVLTSPVNASFAYLDIRSSDVQIERIKFVGWVWSKTGINGWQTINGAVGASGGNNAGNLGITFGYLTPASRIIVQNCMFENLSWGISAGGGGAHLLTDVIVMQNMFKDVATAVQFNGGQEYNIITTSNTIINCADDAIAYLGSPGGWVSNFYLKDSVISGNTIVHNNYYGAGIKLTCNGGILSGISVTGNTIANSSLGIAIWNEQYNDNIHIPTDITITGNTIHAVGRPGLSASGIRFVEYGPASLPSNSIISANLIRTDDYGIFLRNVADLTIANNQINQTGTSGGRWSFQTFNCSNIRVYSNSFIPNPVAYSDAINLLESKNINLKLNSIYAGLYRRYMIAIENSSHIDVEENNFNAARGGPYVIVMTGTSDYCRITRNFFNVPYSAGNFGSYTFLGSNTYVRDNFNMGLTNGSQIAMHDASGTMTGVAGNFFTYEPQSGISTPLATTSIGLVQLNINFTLQYPSGGATNGGSPKLTATLMNPTDTTFIATLSLDQVTVYGFRINLNIATASNTPTAKVYVEWSAELPQAW